MQNLEKDFVDELYAARAVVPVDAGLPPDLGAELRRLLTEHPLVLIDVGARGGMYTVPSLRPYTRVFGFEPDAEECARLNAHPTLSEGHLEFKFFPFALASSSGRVRINICQNPNNSSMLEPNFDVLDPLILAGYDPAELFPVVGAFECDATTLDEFVADQGLSDVDLVKLDTQGSELDIIQGGRRTFAEDVVAATLEVEFKELYKGQPLFRDVDRRMAELGFVLMDLEPIYGNRKSIGLESAGRNEIAWGEAVYVRDALGQRGFFDEADTAKVVRSMLVFESLGFVGYAADVGRAAAGLGRVDGRLADALARAIVERNRQTSAPWYSRQRLESRLHRVARTAYGYVPSPLKALYRRSPLRLLYGSWWRRFRRSRGRWYD